MKQFYLIFFTLISFISSAQELLKDINTSNASSHPRAMVEANGKQFFIAKESTGFSGLWVTDGTTAGTISLKSSAFGSFEYMDRLYSVGDKIVFTTYYYGDNFNFLGKELWVSDGTVAGTSLLKDIYPGGSSSYPRNFISLGSKIVFSATDAEHGEELWVTDGTAAGTKLIKDTNPGAPGSYFGPSAMILHNNKLFFHQSTFAYGYELWVTDGTEEGTYMIKDIYPGSNSSFPYSFAALNDKIYFKANNGVNGDELWVTNGTEAGTYLLKDIQLGSASGGPDELTAINGKLVFKALGPSANRELWVTDGTTEGTMMLKEINPTNSSYPTNSSDPGNFFKVGNEILFTAADGTIGRELWKTDGTTAGTVLVKDINSNSTGIQNLTFAPYNYPLQRHYFVINDILYFLADDGSTGYELWRSDGTTVGTMLVKDITPGLIAPAYSNFAVFGSRLSFLINDKEGNANYWRTDGTTNGTVKLDDIFSGASNIYPLLSVNSTSEYFAAYHEMGGYELFKSNGSTLALVKDVNTNSQIISTTFDYKLADKENVYFSINDNKHGLELWRSDGFGNNTSLFQDFNLFGKNSYANVDFYDDYYSNSSQFGSMHKFNGYYYVSVGSNLWKVNATSKELWQQNSTTVKYMGVFWGKLFWTAFDKLYKSDGNTIEVVYTIPNVSMSTYETAAFSEVNGNLFFVYHNNTSGYELWKTDGTTSGTKIVKEITPGFSSTSFGKFKVVGNKLFFTVNNGPSGAELWVTDGTEAGTVMVKDVNPGSGSSNPAYLTNFNNSFLLFTAYDPVHGTELWRSDGTEGGTYILYDFAPGTMNGGPSVLDDSFTIFQGKAYFSAFTGNYPVKLFCTDGTNVSIVKENFILTKAIVFNNMLYMSAYPGTGGAELWKSDGTSGGTTLVKDIKVGSETSNLQKFFVNDNFLYFIADDGIHGEEPWVLRACPDSLNFNSAATEKNTYRVNKAIVAETANTIASTADITYDAGKYVLLKPGFSTSIGAVFRAKTGGCIYSSITTLSSGVSQVKSDAKTKQYLQDMQEKPGVGDFIQYGNNSNLREVWMRFEEDIRPLIDKERQLNFELNTLEKQRTEAHVTGNQQALSNLYITKAEKERAHEAAKQEVSQYSFFIVPVRNEQGEKLGYDLIIYAGGKVHQSSIRN